MKKNLEALIDEFMIYCITEEQFVQTLNQFLTICAHYGPKVYIRNAHFPSQQVRRCGGHIGDQEYETDGTNIKGIRNMAAAQNAAELSELIHRLEWMQKSILDLK